MKAKRFLNTKSIIHTTAFVSALLMLTGAHAEGGCPPGQYPQQGQGWKTCVPIPGADTGGQQAIPAEQWQDRWGALAVDEADRISGASVGQSSEQSAVDEAIADCKKRDHSGCKRGDVYRNQCVAVIASDTNSDTYGASTTEEASQKGMKGCASKGLSSCHVFYAGCSLPFRSR